MEVVDIRELATINMRLIDDRNVIKCRVNMIKNGRLIGFIKPVDSF